MALGLALPIGSRLLRQEVDSGETERKKKAPYQIRAHSAFLNL
jgi:hypothetical protein